MLPADCPDDLVRAIEERGAIAEQYWREGRRLYVFLRRPDGTRLFARSSTARADRAAIAIEICVREAVGVEGALRSPPVEAWGESWMLERAISSEPIRGDVAIDGVLAAAERLARLDLPDVPEAEYVSRREEPWRAVLRRLRMVRSPLPTRDVLRARRVVAESRLPRVTVHGDFHHRNVLFERGDVWVIDWELAHRGPAGFDLMQMWTELESEADRERLYLGALEIVGRGYADELAALRYALTVRTIAGFVSSRHGFNRDAGEARALLDRLPDLRPSGR